MHFNDLHIWYCLVAQAGIYSDAVECWTFVRKVAGSILGRVRIKDIFLHLLHFGARSLSELNLRSGYWQVETEEEEDKEKTTLAVAALVIFEYNRMTFGLTNAPATFQRLMGRCMGEFNQK